jgi:voltage-gated potassium channel
MKKFLWAVLSPTYWYADYRKAQLSKEARTELIKKYNSRYLYASWLLAGGLGITWQWNEYPDGAWLWPYGILVALLIWIFPLSRCNEIFAAFLHDAYDKVEHLKPESDLTFSDRIRLALHSYLELLSNFAIIYFLLPNKWFSAPLGNMIEALYFSGVTITTLGYGDVHPTKWLPQLLVVYEVFCGFILLIVSFAIYAGRGMNGKRA